MCWRILFFLYFFKSKTCLDTQIPYRASFASSFLRYLFFSFLSVQWKRFRGRVKKVILIALFKNHVLLNYSHNCYFSRSFLSRVFVVVVVEVKFDKFSHAPPRLQFYGLRNELMSSEEKKSKFKAISSLSFLSLNSKS